MDKLTRKSQRNLRRHYGANTPIFNKFTLVLRLLKVDLFINPDDLVAFELKPKSLESSNPLLS